MEKSFYNIYFENKNRKYIYNILSTSIVELEEKVFEDIKNDRLIDVPKEYIDGLINSNIIIDDSSQEGNRYRYYFDSTRFLYTTNDFRITFVPTYGCNLRCPYCYEGQEKKINKITRDKVDKILLFVENEVKNSFISIDRFTVSLFGGEPTLCYEELEYFCSGIAELGEKYGIESFFDITTNFTLIDNRMFDLIKKYQINTQVSIDGPKEEHDKRRYDALGRGTFELIVRNLEKAKEEGLKEQITIRINTDLDNVSNCKEVFKQMRNYSDDVYFGILNKYSGRNDDYKMNCVGKERTADVFIGSLLKLYKDENLEIPVKFGKKNPCSINSINKYMIDCEMNVYKCDLLLNTESYKVGYISNDGEFIRNSNYYKQMAYTPFNYEECQNCKFLPMCAANCPAERILKEGIKDGSIPRGYCMTNEEELIEYLRSYIELIED